VAEREYAVPDRYRELDDRLSVHHARVRARPEMLAMYEGVQSYGAQLAQADHWRRETLPGLDDETTISVTVALVHAYSSSRVEWAARMLLPGLHRRRLPWDHVDVALLFALAAQVKGYWHLDALKVATNAAGHLAPADAATLAPEIRRALTRIESDEGRAGDRARQRAKLRALLPAGAGEVSRVDTRPIRAGDGWSRFAIDRLAAVDEHADRVTQLLDHVAAATSGPRPTKVWERRARELTAGLPGIEALVRDLLEGLVTCEPAIMSRFGPRVRVRVDPDNAVLVRGLLWVAGLLDVDWLVPVVSAIPAVRGMVGDDKVVNAAFATLGRSGGADAIAALIQLKRATRDRGWLKQIARALDEAAAAAGLTRSEMLERAVPDGGLGPDGVRRADVGDAVAIISLEPGGQVRLEWEWDGQRTSRVPGPVADEHTSRVAAVKRDVTELRRLVAAERDRLEDLLVEDRDWPYDQWRTTYLGQPVTRAVAGRLIWRIDDGGDAYAALPVDGAETLMRADGGRVEPGAGARVRPWHPVQADPAQVRAWRALLVEHELVQPFKQAFREVYLLTPAEEETRVYSNRFAAHVLRYQQTFALMKERRWATNYLGTWDGGYHGEAKRDFDGRGLQAIFFHDALDPVDDAIPYCATDQVRFVSLGDRSREPVPLAEVPPVVFSEAMRDVDLFVGVTTIAADPTWADRGEDRHFAYWQTTAFGELGARGETRRDALERLLPRLKIRDRCRIDGRFLVVEGRQRTYKIHLGSGNILMSPNDQYLCIVPARSATPRGVRFVPFDGDEILSVVLAKALLLADDHKITDRTILRQMGG
jgi:hypothetical protein